MPKPTIMPTNDISLIYIGVTKAKGGYVTEQGHYFPKPPRLIKVGGTTFQFSDQEDVSTESRPKSFTWAYFRQGG